IDIQHTAQNEWRHTFALTPSLKLASTAAERAPSNAHGRCDSRSPPPRRQRQCPTFKRVRRTSPCDSLQPRIDAPHVYNGPGSASARAQSRRCHTSSEASIEKRNLKINEQETFPKHRRPRWPAPSAADYQRAAACGSHCRAPSRRMALGSTLKQTGETCPRSACIVARTTLPRRRRSLFQ
ncbi:hypothetical protein M885DRAFT_540584, partial [Pelagophyceae sp. CCMP2097]